MIGPRIASVAVALAVVAALAASPIQAKDGDVRVRGTCTAASTSKLKLSEEDGRIEVELEVDQNRSGVVWRVAVRRNGTLVAATRTTTRGPSGSFTVRRLIPGRAGPDRVVATAISPTGERCVARATL